ncbi:MAG: hypothetical protein FWD38_10575 [Oscillospiraceae bacterium]|nr:hypothetical protein [Oscillospiraceae bacterium]
MTNIEKLINAKIFMDKLSNGIDPVSEEVLTKDALLGNIDLSRCFFFVSDILRQVIENDGFIGRRIRNNVNLPPFTLSDEQLKKIEITERPAMIRHFTESINNLVDISTMRKLKVSAVTKWLAESGYLTEETINEKKRKTPTAEGEKLGIYSEVREGYHGSYLAILYKESAQQHIVANLDKIIAISNRE